MTYHPIDKPTEPGWYWHQHPLHNGRFWPELVEMMRDGSLMRLDQRDGGHDDIVDGFGQWYGPAIEPPAEVNVTQCKASDTPRMFQWTSNTPSEPCGGIGLEWPDGRRNLFDRNHNPTDCSFFKIVKYVKSK